MLSVLLALLQAIPALKSIWDELVAAYISLKISEMKAENVAAIKLAIEKQDQSGLEDAIGSDRSGQMSGIDGTEHRDTLPGVVSDTNKS